MAKNHKKQYFAFILITCWFLLGVGEWNNLNAHRVDFTPDAPLVEVFSFLNWHLYLPEGAWYNTILWGMVGLSYFLIVLLLWFWD